MAFQKPELDDYVANAVRWPVGVDVRRGISLVIVSTTVRDGNLGEGCRVGYRGLTKVDGAYSGSVV